MKAVEDVKARQAERQTMEPQLRAETKTETSNKEERK